MIYLDMDGVLADFDAAVMARGVRNEHSFIHLPKEQWTPAQLKMDEEVRVEMEKPDFWPSIPPMPDAMELYTFCAPFDPVILTATPRETEWRERIAKQKREWITRVFGEEQGKRVITCLRSEKKQYAAQEGDAWHPNILVDDMEANCKEWAKAGGWPIHHKSAADSIHRMGTMLNA